MRVEPDSVHVGIVTVGKESRGKGIATAMYQKAIEYAAERGLPLRSDMSVSADAMRIYESLRRRGYEVTEAPGTTRTAKGATNASARYVFEVKPKAAEEAKSGLIGGEHTVTAADGTKIKVKPEVVEAKDLITSSDKGYDKTLQPRQRDRAASHAQIREIATNLDPERLGYSAEADRGAPIVGPDRMVESGNGRVQALRVLYRANPAKAKLYKDWLKSQGVDVAKYKEPVLVRQRVTALDHEGRKAFTVAANQAATLSMSAPERAIADADNITPHMLDLIRDGDLGSLENRGFVRALIGTLPASERGNLASTEGGLSAEGLARVKNAVLAKAYGDPDIVSRVTESTDDDVKSISNALVAAAPAWAKLRSDIEVGAVPKEFDFTKPLVEAVKRTADMRAKGQKLEEYLAQQDAFDHVTPDVDGFIRAFYDPRTKRAKSAVKIADTLRFYATEAAKVSTEEGLGLGLPKVTPHDIQAAASAKSEEAGARPVRPSNEEAGAEQRGRATGKRWPSPDAKKYGGRRPGFSDIPDLFGSEPGADNRPQLVIPGTEHRSADLAKRRAAEPLKPKAEQKAADLGLFARPEGKQQLDLVDQVAEKERAPAATAEAKEYDEWRDAVAQGLEAIKAGKPIDDELRDLIKDGDEEDRALIVGNRLTTHGHDWLAEAKKAPTSKEGAPNGPSSAAPASDLFGGALQPVPARNPRNVSGRRGSAPERVRRPDDLPLFAGEGGGGVVHDANDAASAEPAVSKPPASTEGERSSERADGSRRVRAPGAGKRSATGGAAAGLKEAREKIAERSRLNYRITDEDQIGEGGPKVKAHGNIEAIRTLKAIEDEAREATPEEKAVLVKYTGWGALGQQLFDTRAREGWDKEREALRSLLTDEEYEAAKASTLNAHFTSPEVIRGIWAALNHLGFEGGLALEPSAGVGHFIGLTPDYVAPKTAWTATELDPITGRIAQKLYAGAEVHVQGYQDLKRPSNYYDLAISNVPFGDYSITEKPYGSHSIHDFFFVKSLDKVRPGGVVAFITSRYTMDKLDPSVRRLLSKSSDLVGAIRLPGGKKGAFAGNAGTDVTTDIVFLRKKIPGEAPFPGHAWNDVKPIETPDGPVVVNQYFAKNPGMMLGEMRLQGTMYGKNEPVLVGDTEGLSNKIAEAAATMPRAFTARGAAPPPDEISGYDIEGPVKDGAFFVKGDKVFQKRAGSGFEQKLSADDHDRVKRLVGIRDIYNDLMATQLANTEGRSAAQSGSALLRAKLQDAYKSFVKKYGPINKESRTVTDRIGRSGEPIVLTRYPNFAKFKSDPDAWKVAAIENYDAETDRAVPADVQTKDVIEPPRDRKINGPADAMAASLDDTGGVDLSHIAESLGLESDEAAAHAMGDLVYLDPDGRKWKASEDYLSGDVVKKLEDARAVAARDATYNRNVAALEKVQPEPLTRADITAQFGAPWVPEDVYKDFLEHALGATNPDVKRVPLTGDWRVSLGSMSRDGRTKYGTDRVGADKIFAAAINNKTLTVYDKDADGKPVVNQKATEEARIKADLLREAFAGDMDQGSPGWAFEDDERARRLETIYNRTYNNLVPRRYDGSHLTLPGMNPDFSGRQHRKDAIWRIVQKGNTLLAHVVGSGKTVTMIGAGMEQKRLGLINKPAYVIPNHMLEQFSREFIQAYPNAKIIVASKEEMSPDSRKAFLAKVANNDWDGVVITHDAFGRVDISPQFRKQFIKDQMDVLERVIRAEKAASDKASPTVKQLEKLKARLQDKLGKLLNEARKDDGTSFEESGIDHLFVDEAHLFKNLAFITRMSRVKGLGQGDAQRAEDLFLKMRYLEQKRPQRSAVFATGTPVSNTMAELWTMMRYLMLDDLKERNLDNFDDWASTFGKVVTNMELSADGRTYKEVSSFSKFVNVPELISLYSEIADTKTADMLQLPRPDVVTRSGNPGIEIVEAEPSPQEEQYIQKLVQMAEEMKGKRPEKGQPNMLSVVTLGRKVATDGRLIGENFDFNSEGKVAKAVNNIHDIWARGQEPGMAQMVFLDLGVPSSRKQGEGEAGPGG